MPEQTPKDRKLIALLATTDFDGYNVVRHGYEEMRVIGRDVTDGPFEYTDEDPFYLLQYRLAAAAGERVDNKECYEVTSPDGQKLCLWFHDWRLVVGTAVRPY